MKYTRLGNSELNVSRICMGCMGFGDPGRGQHSWTIDEEHSREIIKRGLELGVNFYDTAIAYQSGTSEQYVGRALRDFAKREDVVVATKFLPRTQDEIERGISGQQHIGNMIDASLQNLGMDYVDLYIYHMWDWQTPLFDIMDGLDRIVKAGKARYIGISNCFAWQIAKANALAEKEGFAKFVSIQGHYNLIFREEEREMVPFCKEENIALTPYSALASGRLSRLPGQGGTKRAEEDAYAKFKYDATAEQDNVIIARVAELAEKHGVTMTEVSLAWLLTKVTSPVVGATKFHHIEGAAKAVDLELSPEELLYLEEPYVPHPLAGVMAQNKPAAEVQKEAEEAEAPAPAAQSDVLVAFFSATGTTKGVAEKIASVTGGDLYEILAAEPYTADDLNYNDSSSRSTKEQDDKSARPGIGSEEISLEGYTTIYLGFPIWWGEEPRIMDTFVEKYSFEGITVIPFCTSGGSGIGRSGPNMEELAGSGTWLEGRRFDGGVSEEELQSWIEGMK